jgi:hypothetical protein
LIASETFSLDELVDVHLQNQNNWEEGNDFGAPVLSMSVINKDNWETVTEES